MIVLNIAQHGNDWLPFAKSLMRQPSQTLHSNFMLRDRPVMASLAQKEQCISCRWQQLIISLNNPGIFTVWGIKNNNYNKSSPGNPPNLSFPLRHGPHNAPMPGPTPLTAPNGSWIASRTFAQLRKKLPVGYNGTPRIYSQNCPFLWDNCQSMPHP